MTSDYGIFTIEILPPQSSKQPSHHVQTDYLELDFSKVFIEYKKNKQHQNSQLVNSNYRNDVFSITYNWV